MSLGAYRINYAECILSLPNLQPVYIPTDIVCMNPVYNPYTYMYELAYDSYIYVVACIQSNWNASDGQSVKRSSAPLLARGCPLTPLYVTQRPHASF